MPPKKGTKRKAVATSKKDADADADADAAEAEGADASSCASSPYRSASSHQSMTPRGAVAVLGIVAGLRDCSKAVGGEVCACARLSSPRKVGVKCQRAEGTRNIHRSSNRANLKRQQRASRQVLHGWD